MLLNDLGVADGVLVVVLENNAVTHTSVERFGWFVIIHATVNHLLPERIENVHELATHLVLTLVGRRPSLLLLKHQP